MKNHQKITLLIMAIDNLTVVVSLVDKASKQAMSISTSIAAIGKVAALAGAAVAALGVVIGIVAVKEFAKFEKSMSNVKAITNATGEDMNKMSDLAREMGRTTAFTAKEAAEGMTFLGMAGFDTNEIMKALPDTLNLAAASNIELGRAADIASNVLTGFRLQAGEAGRVVDVLAKTVTSSNTDMNQLSEAMKLFAPSAATFGISVEEASAAVGLLGNAGLQGSVATTALSTSLVRLSKPTKEMKTTIKQLGLDFFDTNGEFIGMANTIELLEDRFRTMTPEQESATIATIFGARAVKQWSVLVAAGSDDLREFTGELENSAGAAQQMADIQLDNLSGAYTLLKSAVNGVLIEIGGKLAPALKNITQDFTELTTAAMTDGVVMNFVDKIIGGLSDAFIFLKDMVALAKEGFDFLGEGLNATNMIFGENQNNLEALTQLYTDLKPVIDVLAASIGIGLKVAIESVSIVVNGLIEGLNVLFDLGQGLGKLLGKITGIKTAASSARSKVGKLFGFADGGIVPEYFASGGQAKGTDTVPAMLTPGELILNKAQQKNVAGSMGGVTINIQGNLIGNRQAAIDLGNQIASQLGLSTAMA